jgi:hypothetical protein
VRGKCLNFKSEGTPYSIAGFLTKEVFFGVLTGEGPLSHS